MRQLDSKNPRNAARKITHESLPRSSKLSETESKGVLNAFGVKRIQFNRGKNRKGKDWILPTRKSKIKLERKRAESRNTGGLRREKLGRTISLGGDVGY